MGVISIRLNKNEEKILNTLTEYYGLEKSALIKKSLYDLYENIADLRAIEEFERKESSKKTSFLSADELLKQIE